MSHNPGRRLINRTFLAMAVYAGIDTLLMDVRDRALLSSIYASEVLTNQAPYCLRSIQAYRGKRLSV
jgi:5-methyltetrahydrofolate--homocysteine methyltransferase